MARFFVNRPIVAIVIAIVMVILGIVSLVQLPVALYPNIAPPEIQITANYVGRQGTLGALGVIGPSRMPYATLIPIVDYTAGMLSRLLDEDLERE